MINRVSSVAGATYTQAYSNFTKVSENVKATNDTAVIYKPSNILYKNNNSAVIMKMKADSDKRIEQMKELTTNMFERQGFKLAGADEMWVMLANGKFVAEEATITQAKADISPGGYWSVDSTSERIFDFATSLAGGNDATMRKMREAVEQGFEAATKSWGQNLPEISTNTLDAVMKKFDDYFAKEIA